MRVDNAPASAGAKPCGTLEHCTIDEDQHRTYAHNRAAHPRVTRSVIRFSRHRLGGRGRMADETPAIPGLNRRTLLRGGLAAGAGAAVAGLATVGLAGAAQAATAARSVARSAKPSAVEPDLTYQTQYYWAYCVNCAGLWYTANKTAGACPYYMLGKGGGHVLNPS